MSGLVVSLALGAVALHLAHRARDAADPSAGWAHAMLSRLAGWLSLAALCLSPWL